MNLWPHNDWYEKTVHKKHAKVVCRFDEAPECSIKHLTKTVLTPMAQAIVTAVPKTKINKLNVKCSAVSSRVMLNYGDFAEKKPLIRKTFEDIAPVGDFGLVLLDNQPSSYIEFAVEIFFEE